MIDPQFSERTKQRFSILLRSEPIFGDTVGWRMESRISRMGIGMGFGFRSRNDSMGLRHLRHHPTDPGYVGTATMISEMNGKLFPTKNRLLKGYERLRIVPPRYGTRMRRKVRKRLSRGLQIRLLRALRSGSTFGRIIRTMNSGRRIERGI